MEVLETALALMAQRGVAGASLRELARRLGMSQPSLYHYFSTKDDLVAQIVDHCGLLMMTPQDGIPLPESAHELPRFVVRSVFALWKTERHASFVRFMFAIALERPEYRELLRELFVTRFTIATTQIVALFPDAPIPSEELGHLLRMVVCSVGLPLIEERALIGDRTPSAEVARYAEFVIRTAEETLVTAEANRRVR